MRHPSTEHLMRWLTPNPRLPEGPPSAVANLIYGTAVTLLNLVPEDGPELTVALRCLLDAKDAAVRQAIDGLPRIEEEAEPLSGYAVEPTE